MARQWTEARPVRSKDLAGQLLSECFQFIHEARALVETIIRTVPVSHIPNEKRSDRVTSNVLGGYEVETLLAPPSLMLID